MGSFAIRIKVKDANRHILVGDGELTNRRLHAISFKTIDKAIEYAKWLLAHNKDEFVSAQVIKFHGGRVLRTFTAEDLGAAT